MPDAPAALPEPFAGWFARARLAAASAPARAARPRRRPRDAADRPDRRRQDPRGLPAEPRRARPRPPPGPAHPLRLAAEGARRRHPPQPRRARSPRWTSRVRVEDRTGDTGAAAARPPARRPAAHPADHPGIARADALLPGGPGDLRRALPRHRRRDPRARRNRSAATSSTLGLARLQTLAPGLRRVGLSATVEDPPALAAFLGRGARVLLADPGPEPDIADPRDRRAAALGRPDRRLRRPRR